MMHGEEFRFLIRCHGGVIRTATTSLFSEAAQYIANKQSRELLLLHRLSYMRMGRSHTRI